MTIVLAQSVFSRIKFTNSLSCSSLLSPPNNSIRITPPCPRETRNRRRSSNCGCSSLGMTGFHLTSDDIIESLRRRLANPAIVVKATAPHPHSTAAQGEENSRNCAPSEDECACAPQSRRTSCNSFGRTGADFNPASSNPATRLRRAILGTSRIHIQPHAIPVASRSHNCRTNNHYIRSHRRQPSRSRRRAYPVSNPKPNPVANPIPNPEPSQRANPEPSPHANLEPSQLASPIRGAQPQPRQTTVCIRASADAALPMTAPFAGATEAVDMPRSQRQQRLQ